MIEKLEKHIIGENAPGMVSLMVAPTAEQQVDKINELCDVVNEQQKQIDKMSCAILDLTTPNGENKALESIKAESKTPVDPYAEQRKWVGKLCRFWDDNSKITKHFGTLTRIDEYAIVPYEAENGFWYCACEPVKLDDDIIYKGGDNDSPAN